MFNVKIKIIQIIGNADGTLNQNELKYKMDRVELAAMLADLGVLTTFDKNNDGKLTASGPHPDLMRAPYSLCGVKYIDPVSLAPVPGHLAAHSLLSKSTLT